MSASAISIALSLAVGVMCAPMGVALTMLFILGKRLTEPKDRTKLGTWLAWFCLCSGAFLLAMAVLLFLRWGDLDGSDVPYVISMPLRVLALASLIGANVCVIGAAPHMIDRIENGILIDPSFTKTGGE